MRVIHTGPSDDGLAAFRPHRYFERPMLPPIIPPAPLPGLREIPTRLDTETLRVDTFDGPSAIEEVMEKVRAEDARGRRLLPPAPRGHEWRAELQTQEPALDFIRGAGTVEVRLVYRLVEVER